MKIQLDGAHAGWNYSEGRHEAMINHAAPRNEFYMHLQLNSGPNLWALRYKIRPWNGISALNLKISENLRISVISPLSGLDFSSLIRRSKFRPPYGGCRRAPCTVVLLRKRVTGSAVGRSPARNSSCMSPSPS